MELEKRINPRLDFGILVYCNGRRGMTKDISANGTFVVKDEYPKQLAPLGSDVALSFDFPTTEDSIDTIGTVMHHGKDGEGMGIWFKRIDDRTKEFIKMFVSDRL